MLLCVQVGFALLTALGSHQFRSLLVPELTQQMRDAKTQMHVSYAISERQGCVCRWALRP